MQPGRSVSLTGVHEALHRKGYVVKTFCAAMGGIIVAGLVSGCAAERAKTPPPPTVVSETTESKGRVERQDVTTVTATVVGVNQAKREVTLKGPEGDVETVHVGDEVRNLAQVHKGDQVVVKYYQSLAFQLNQKGKAKPGEEAVIAAGRAPLGAKPAGAVGNSISITATVTKVDRENNTLSLKGPKGRMAVVHVKEPRYLENVKKGDTIDATYTEALAISVEPAS